MDVAAWLHSQSMRYEHASMEDKKRINSLDQQRAETWFEEYRVYFFKNGLVTIAWQHTDVISGHDLGACA